MPPRSETRSYVRRRAFWIFVLLVIGLDLWWSGTPLTFQVWWIPLIAANLVCLTGVLYPIIVNRN